MRSKQPKDFYAILGVAHTASWEEIRAAFRSQAKLLHPDKNRHHDTSDDFRRLREAYVGLRRLGHLRAHHARERPVAEPSHVHPPAPPPAPIPQPVPPGPRLAAFAVPTAALLVLSVAIYAWVATEPSAPPGALMALEDHFRTSVASYLIQPEPSPPDGMTVVGRGGKKFTVSPGGYGRLQTLRTQLMTERKDLEGRKSAMEARRKALGEEESTLDRSDPHAVVDFQLKVNAFNRDLADFRWSVEVHMAELEAYFKQVDALVAELQ